jgi:hypothetical protein
MEIRKAHAFSRQLVEHGRLNLTSERPYVAVAQVVGNNEKNIRKVTLCISRLGNISVREQEN